MFQFVNIALTVMIVPLVFIGLTIVFFVFFLKRYFDSKHKMFAYLSVFFATYLLQNIFQVGEFLLQPAEEAKIFFTLRELFDMLVLYSLVVLLEVFENDTGLSKRQFLMSTLVFISIGGMISTPTFLVDETSVFAINYGNEEPVWLIEIIFFIVAGIWLILMLYRNHSRAWSSKQKSLMKWLFWGVFFAIFFQFIAWIVIFFASLTSTLLLLISLVIFLVVRNLGVIFIGIAFLRASKEPWLLQRHRVHFLIVYSKDGIQLYSKIFSKNLKEERTLLLAGGFSAITSIFKEATETTGGIKSILLEDKELRIINKPMFISAILVDFSTQASEIAHVNFTREFDEKFKEELESFDGEVSIFEKAGEIIKKYFA